MTTNDLTVFEGEVEKNVEVLLKWTALDRDRTMLFAAKLGIAVSGMAE